MKKKLLLLFLLFFVLLFTFAFNRSTFASGDPYIELDLSSYECIDSSNPDFDSWCWGYCAKIDFSIVNKPSGLFRVPNLERYYDQISKFHVKSNDEVYSVYKVAVNSSIVTIYFSTNDYDLSSCPDNLSVMIDPGIIEISSWEYYEKYVKTSNYVVDWISFSDLNINDEIHLGDKIYKSGYEGYFSLEWYRGYDMKSVRIKIPYDIPWTFSFEDADLSEWGWDTTVDDLPTDAEKFVIEQSWGPEEYKIVAVYTHEHDFLDDYYIDPRDKSTAICYCESTVGQCDYPWIAVKLTQKADGSGFEPVVTDAWDGSLTWGEVFGDATYTIKYALKGTDTWLDAPNEEGSWVVECVLGDDKITLTQETTVSKYNLSVVCGTTNNGIYAGIYPGTKVTIIAGEYEGKMFDGWYILDGDQKTLLEKDNSTYTFEMPTKDIVILAEFKQCYPLIISNGVIMTGSPQKVGDTVAISAPASPDEGLYFHHWQIVGSTLTNEQINAASFDFTMPDNTATLTAVYIRKMNITVNGGTISSGDSKYFAGETATIEVNAADNDKKFISWSVNGITLSEEVLKNREITFTVPENDVTFTPNYEYSHSVNVTGGSANGLNANNKAFAGSTVTITANEKDNDKKFASWIVEGLTLSEEDLKKSTISFEMPETNVYFSVNYEYSHIVNITGGAATAGLNASKKAFAGDSVTIVASDDTADKRFKNWVATGISLNESELGNKELTFVMPSNDISFSTDNYSSYTVSVVGGTIVSGAINGKAFAGDTITIQATTPEVGSFKKWVSNDVNFDNNLSSTASFVMTEKQVSITVEYCNIPVVAPTAGTSTYTYDGMDWEYEFADEGDKKAYKVSGNIQRNAGTYEVTVSLIDKENTVWSDDGTTIDKKYSFFIDYMRIPKPSGDPRTFVENGKVQTYHVVMYLDGCAYDFNGKFYNITGNKQSAKGTYQVKVKPLDNYAWEDDEDGREELIFDFVIRGDSSTTCPTNPYIYYFASAGNEDIELVNVVYVDYWEMNKEDPTLEKKPLSSYCTPYIVDAPEGWTYKCYVCDTPSRAGARPFDEVDISELKSGTSFCVYAVFSKPGCDDYYTPITQESILYTESHGFKVLSIKQFEEEIFTGYELHGEYPVLIPVKTYGTSYYYETYKSRVFGVTQIKDVINEVINELEKGYECVQFINFDDYSVAMYDSGSIKGLKALQAKLLSSKISTKQAYFRLLSTGRTNDEFGLDYVAREYPSYIDDSHPILKESISELPILSLCGEQQLTKLNEYFLSDELTNLVSLNNPDLSSISQEKIDVTFIYSVNPDNPTEVNYKTVQLEPGSLIEGYEIPEIPGYVFRGWYYLQSERKESNSETIGQTIDPNKNPEEIDMLGEMTKWNEVEDKVSHNIILYACWGRENSISNLTLANWTYGSTPNIPTANSVCGQIVYTYSTEEDGVYTDTVPQNAGTYYVKAEVFESNEFTGACEKLAFVIEKATYDLSNAKWNYTEAFSYDGESKTVELIGLPDGVTVKEYTGNTATDVGEYTASVVFDYDTINYNIVTFESLNWAITEANKHCTAVHTLLIIVFAIGTGLVVLFTFFKKNKELAIISSGSALFMSIILGIFAGCAACRVFMILNIVLFALGCGYNLYVMLKKKA